MKILLALILGIGIGIGAYWLYTSDRGRDAVRSTSDQVGDAAGSARDAVQAKLRVLDLRSEDIKDELARSGQVVRRKAQEAGQAISDATADARTTASIKARLLANPDLSSMNISVNTTAGVVTLSGSVGSTEEISKAMLIAMETQGVREVISTLQIKPANTTTKPPTNSATTPVATKKK